MDTLGALELKSIAAGVESTDAMLKAASVQLVRAGSICSGRYLTFVSGDRETVEISVRAGASLGRGVVGQFIIARVAPQLITAMKKADEFVYGEAIGLVESRIVSACVAAADIALKAAQIRLIRFVAGQGIMGKGYFVVGGEVSAVREAVDAATSCLGSRLVDSCVIPRPEEALVKTLTSGGRL